MFFPHSPPTQARPRCSTGHSLAGHSPSPAALSAMEHLVAYAVRKGHLSPIYIQPFLVKGENCLVPLQKASPKKGKTFNLLGLPLDSPLLISNGHWGQPFPSGFHWIPTDKQLVTQLSETLLQSNLEKGSPGHHVAPQISGVLGPWHRAWCDICAHSFNNIFIPSTIQQFFTELVTEDAPSNKTHRSSFSFMKFQTRG